MKTLKVNTWLPVFSGFYGTMWESTGEENELDDINEQRTEKGLPAISYDAVDWDYNEYHKDIVEGIVLMVAGDLEKKGLIAGHKLEGLLSPREYNFHNDSIYVEFKLTRGNIQTILKYLNKYSEKFRDYIYNRYTSYNGFSSSYSNDSDVWVADIKETLSHPHKLGSILQFVLLNDYILEGHDEGGLEWNYKENFMDYPWIHAKNYNELVSR